MFLGLLYAIGACFVWGLVFVVPQYLSDFSAVEVVLGRYFTYGILSLFLIFFAGKGQFKRYTVRAWGMAFLFALLSNLVYYLGLVAGLRFASPTLTVMIVGMAPLLIAFYGNWHARELPFRDLALPCLWIGLGLILVNAAAIDWSFQATTIGQYIIGLVGIFVALTAWSWYAVHNARFLKRHTHIPAGEWSTVLGMATLVWTLIFGFFFSFGNEEIIHLKKILTLSPEMLRYWGGVTILGVICSWIGCFLWSRATLFLPVALMGPLLLFEILFGMIFIFAFQSTLPSWLELGGATLMIVGILMSIFAFRKTVPIVAPVSDKTKL
jgi:drug/metabolite transporter (DMT)-like permease